MVAERSFGCDVEHLWGVEFDVQAHKFASCSWVICDVPNPPSPIASPAVLHLVQRTQAFQEFLSFLELRKEFFFLLECGRMHHASAAAQLDGMPQVKHLMINKIFDGIERDARRVENAADDNSVMRGIIVTQAA